mgnify:FL=1
MGKKRIKELQKQVKEAQKTLAALEKKKDKKVLKAQHKVIEELEVLIGQESLRAETLVELSEEAWQEAKGLIEGLITKVKNIVK